MIHYHGMPITPATAAAKAVDAGHSFVSFAHPDQLSIAIELCQSFAIDNGAFSAWKSGNPVKDWDAFYDWALNLKKVLEQLANTYVRVCIGSSGEFATVGSQAWWSRIGQAMRILCDEMGRPMCKLHGLRMLDPAIFTKLPFASADSTNIGRNIGIDNNWKVGNYLPPTKEMRAAVMRSRIESHNAPAVWGFHQVEQGLLL